MNTHNTGQDDVVHNPDSANHFEVLGLPHRLLVDRAELSRKFYALSREYHPDFHQTGSAAERIASVTRTAAINAAYNTLRDPAALGRWWLEFKGGQLGNSNQVPPELMMLVMTVQELLEDVRTSKNDAALAQADEQLQHVEAQRDERMERLRKNFETWDARGHDNTSTDLLTELKEILSETSYLTTLIRNIETTLESVRTT